MLALENNTRFSKIIIILFLSYREEWFSLLIYGPRLMIFLNISLWLFSAGVIVLIFFLNFLFVLGDSFLDQKVRYILIGRKRYRKRRIRHLPTGTEKEKGKLVMGENSSSISTYN